MQKCPQCNGETELAGDGRGQCFFCGCVFALHKGGVYDKAKPAKTVTCRKCDNVLTYDIHNWQIGAVTCPRCFEGVEIRRTTETMPRKD